MHQHCGAATKSSQVEETEKSVKSFPQQVSWTESRDTPERFDQPKRTSRRALPIRRTCSETSRSRPTMNSVGVDQYVKPLAALPTPSTDDFRLPRHSRRRAPATPATPATFREQQRSSENSSILFGYSTSAVGLVFEHKHNDF